MLVCVCVCVLYVCVCVCGITATTLSQYPASFQWCPPPNLMELVEERKKKITARTAALLAARKLKVAKLTDPPKKTHTTLPSIHR